ncbi:uncharacterized protein J3R85_010777 [Psidium guajava]|nr:uncharacterized protein J3R85_010777 [Psidium guajava]
MRLVLAASPRLLRSFIAAGQCANAVSALDNDCIRSSSLCNAVVGRENQLFFTLSEAYRWSSPGFCLMN